MALLWDVDRVCRDTATCLDDPSMSEYEKDYLLPFINLKWQDLAISMEKIGLDYLEQRIVLPAVPAGTLSLDDYMTSGGPLESLMQPKVIEWKQVGTSDIQYNDAFKVSRLGDFDGGMVGIRQWKWAGGSVQLTPSDVDVDIRITFDAMTVQLVDPTDQMVRGVSNIIAYRVASFIYAIRGNAALQKTMSDYADDAMENFEVAAVMRDQANKRRVPPMHPRLYRAGVMLGTPST